MSPATVFPTPRKRRSRITTEWRRPRWYALSKRPRSALTAPCDPMKMSSFAATPPALLSGGGPVSCGGGAPFNPAIRTPGALHAALRRTGDLYTEPHDKVVDRIIAQGVAITPTARVRLLVFAGHGHIGPGTTIHLGDAARFIRSHLASRQDLYRITRFADPVVGLLALFDKVG